MNPHVCGSQAWRVADEQYRAAAVAVPVPEVVDTIAYHLPTRREDRHVNQSPPVRTEIARHVALAKPPP
ncbi:MAG: hypothetical protein QOK17_2120 [Sphingomonadales bacterium]|nr:hypothetical protein [Sphingomonadales bacterium]